jgi:hypothetical protein
MDPVEIHFGMLRTQTSFKQRSSREESETLRLTVRATLTVDNIVMDSST